MTHTVRNHAEMRPDLQAVGSPEIEQEPHHNLLAEAAVLGSMMMASGGFYDCRDAVIETFGKKAASVFYRPAHQIIYAAIVELYTAGEPTDPIVVGNHLEKQGHLARAGGHGCLSQLVGMADASAEYHAEIVLDKARLRHMEEAVVRSRQAIRAGEGEADEIISWVQEHVDQAADATGDDSECLSIGDLLPAVYDRMEEDARSGDQITGIRTGWPDLDRRTQGLQPGQVIVLAGSPGTGKTTAAVNLMCNAAFRENVPSAMFSLEMPKEHVVRRILAAENGVPLGKIKSGALSEDEWAKVAKTSNVLANAPLWFDGSGDMTLDQIASRVRTLKRQRGVQLVVIDYFQIIRKDTARYGGNSHSAYEDMMNQIRAIARTQEVTIVLLSQLNRDAGRRQDSVPSMHDLMGSSALEANAHIIILMHRPDLYEPESARAGEMDLIIAKNRDGATGIVTLATQMHYSRLTNMPGANQDTPPIPVPYSDTGTGND